MSGNLPPPSDRGLAASSTAGSIPIISVCVHRVDRDRPTADVRFLPSRRGLRGPCCIHQCGLLLRRTTLRVAMGSCRLSNAQIRRAPTEIRLIRCTDTRKLTCCFTGVNEGTHLRLANPNHTLVEATCNRKKIKDGAAINIGWRNAPQRDITHHALIWANPIGRRQSAISANSSLA